MGSNTALRASPHPFRGLIVGYPKSGKTGMIAALANAGYKIRLIDMEGNSDPLINYSDPRADIDVAPVLERLKMGERFIETTNTESTFNQALSLGKEWKYKDPLTGEEIDHGKPLDWGPDTVMILDSMTAMADAALDRAMGLNNSTPKYIPPAVYGQAVMDLKRALNLLMRKDKGRYHFIALGHLRMLGPDDYIKMDEKDDKKHPELKPVLDAKLEAINDELLPVRLLPWAVTKNQSPIIHKDFPIMLRAELVTRHGSRKRVLQTATAQPIDLAFPLPNAKAEYPIETGLATLFELLGHKAPGLNN